jgi:hypothetical protein
VHSLVRLCLLLLLCIGVVFLMNATGGVVSIALCTAWCGCCCVAVICVALKEIEQQLLSMLSCFVLCCRCNLIFCLQCCANKLDSLCLL